MPKQDVSVELFYDGTWHNLAAVDDVFADTPIVIQRGDGDESAAPRPTSITLRLANDDDMYRTSNPESPLYGKAGVNTWLRVRVAGFSRAIGEVSSWRCGQSRDFRRFPPRGKAWVDIEANGLLQRINQWTEPIQSTMVKGMLSFGDDLVGIWPLEDESTSTILSQLVPGGKSGTLLGDVTLGDSERPGGSARSAKLGAGSRMNGVFIRSTASGWQISFAVKLAALPGSATYEEIFRWYDSTGRRWIWQVNNANFAWTAFDPDGGTVLSTLASTYSGREPNQWVRCRMKVSISGGTITYEPAWYVEGDASEAGTSATFAATSTGHLTTWSAIAATYNIGAWYTGVFGLDDPTAVIFNAGVKADFNGHPNEAAGLRFDRILDDLGLAHDSNGDLAASTLMGPQPADTLPNILREIRDTDDAVLFESRNTVNLVLTVRNGRYRQTPTLTLNALANPSGMPNLPTEVTDDLPIHNLVTASQRDGGQVTAEDSTSSMGTQPPPDGRGEYRQQVDVNVGNPVADLPQQANWWLRRGTVDRPRFPQVVVNMGALDSADRLNVENVTIGSVIEIINYREYTIRLYVLGYTETIGTHSRMIVFTCAPDQQFQVGEWDATDSLWDLKTCTLAAAAGIGVTTLTLSTTSALESWSTTSAYDLLISGELVGVPAGGMSARSGTGPYTQTVTGAVRSKNGIRKTLPAGAGVHVATPGRWAL